MSEPIATLFVIIATLSVSIWAFGNEEIERKLIFRPESILADKEYYRLVSSSFLHAGWGHLLLNVYTLYHFGGAIERQFGPLHFLLIYFGSVVGGDLFSLYIHRHHDYSAYGASGGVCGLIFAYILKFPSTRMMMFPLPYAVPAWLFAIAFVIGSFYAMKVQMDNVGHDAHLGGAIIGLFIAAGLQPELIGQHWVVFTTLLLLASAIFAFVLVNPLFLPISSFIQMPRFTLKRSRPRPARPKPENKSFSPQMPQRPQPRPKPNEPQPDWLIEEIEVHVGKLKRDESGLHDWIDRFGRTYDVVGGRAESFNLQSFTAAVLDHLDRPDVRFVIVDTRQLQESQVALLRPFIADLPEDQSKRIIRSYGFNSRQQH